AAEHAHAAKPFVINRVGRKKPGDRNVKLPHCAIELIAHAEAQPADAGPLHDLGKGRLRIETGDERLGAERIGDRTGCGADRNVGPADGEQSRHAGNNNDARDPKPPSPVHNCPRAITCAFYRAFCAPPTDGNGCTVTPGGGTSSSGTKKSDINGTLGSTR